LIHIKRIFIGIAIILFAILLAFLNNMWLPYIGEIEFRAISFFIGIIGLLLIVKGALEK